MSREKRNPTTIEILLDEDVMPRYKMPRLNRRVCFRMRHIAHDMCRGGIKDGEVLNIAVKNSQVLITFDNGFKKRRPQKKAAIVIIKNGDTMTADELQDEIIDFFKMYKYPEEIVGKVFNITQSYIYEV